MSHITWSKAPEAHIGHIVIDNAAKANAFTLAMVRQFGEALHQLEADDSIKVIVIQSAGNDLTVGLDVGEVESMYRSAESAGPAIPSQRARLAAHHDHFWGPQGLYDRLLHCRKITVVEARGRCFDIGLYLSLYSDLVLASDDATFAMPRWRHVGIDGDIAMLVAAVGLKRAKELIFCSAAWTALEAQEYGLIDNVFTAAALPDAVALLAGACASIMRDGIAAEKQIVFASLAKMQISTGFAAASVAGGWSSNIHHREGEFNFLRERREHGAAEAMRRSNVYFQSDR